MATASASPGEPSGCARIYDRAFGLLENAGREVGALVPQAARLGADDTVAELDALRRALEEVGRALEDGFVPAWVTERYGEPEALA